MSTTTVPKKEHKGAGHRGRLRERFLQGGLDAFLDYEIVELLLTLNTPRRDCKDMAKQAIAKFKGLKGVLDAPAEELQQINGIGPSNVFGLKLFQAVAQRLAKESMPEKVELNSIPRIAEYFKKKIGKEQREYFIALYLDGANQIIAEKIVSIGVLNMSLVQPREVFQTAITKGAATIVIAHNHPSGKIDPSVEDREVTKQLIETGRIMGIEILDHIIVSNSVYFSFKQELLI